MAKVVVHSLVEKYELVSLSLMASCGLATCQKGRIIPKG
jgi:hypothetical protein